MIKFFYRIRQAAFSVVMNMIKGSPIITNECGSLLKIPSFIREDGCDRAFIVTTPGFIKRETLLPLFSALEKEEIVYSVYTGVIPDPDFDSVENGLSEYLKNGRGIIVAVGGGSVIDCAKMIAARAVKPNKPLEKMKGLLKITKKIAPIYAVPTTSGTGSEVTVAAVLTDKNHAKYAYEDPSLLPKRAILDPTLTLGLSPYLTAVSGMDALTHAVEAYTNRYSSRYVKKCSEEAVRLIFENLEKACTDGADLEARKSLLYASMLAGKAINRGFVGYVHAIAHSVGGKCGVAHGEACAVLLPDVLKQYGNPAEKKLASLARVIGIYGDNDHALASDFIERIRSLRAKIELPSAFSSLIQKDVPELAKRAIHEANPLYPVPRIWDEVEFFTVLQNSAK